MSYGLFLEDDRLGAVFRVRFFAAIDVSNPHALGGRAAIADACIKHSLVARSNRSGAQLERTQASSFASKMVFGGQPIELAYALKSRRLFPCFSASCCNSRIRSPMIAYVEA